MPALQQSARRMTTEPDRVRALGGTFTPDPATGAGTFAIPLDLPAGPDGIGPGLALRYDTRGGDGPFGAGFTLPLPRILLGRAPDVALEGAGEIVTRPGGTLGLRVDDGTWQVARRGDGFLLTSRSGARHVLGASPGGRTAGAWHLERIEDALGNTAEFSWLRDGESLYPEWIGYGPYEISFGYEASRCVRIDLRCPAEPQPLVRRWTFGYSGASLTSVTMTGFDADGEAETAPVLRLSYTEPSPSPRLAARVRPRATGSGVLLLEAESAIQSTSDSYALTEIDNGLGLRTEVEYSAATVVRRVVHHETRTGHRAETRFSYDEDRVIQEELGDEYAPTSRTIRWFDTDGRMVREEAYGPDDRLCRRVSTVDKNVTTTELFEGEEPVSIITVESSDFDDFGNSRRTREITGQPGEDPVVLETHMTYAKDPEHRFAALPARIRQFDGAGNLVSDTMNRYDERPDGSAGTRGLLTARESLVLTDALVADLYGPLIPDFTAHGYHRRSGEGGWWATTFYHRLSTVTGLRGMITGPRGYTTEVRYSADRCFAEVFTDPHGNVTTTRHDRRTGRVHTQTEASGAVFTARYDPLGRKAIVVQPGDSPALPTFRYHYDNSCVTTEQRAVSGEVEVLVTSEIRDGAGRLLQRRHSDHLGDVVDEHHDYCARGFVRHTTGPFRATAAGTFSTEFRYDALGRPLSVPSQDEADDAVTTYDLLGRVLRVASPDRTVVYLRDSAGNPIETRTAGGHTVFRTYDACDRVVAVCVDEPDSPPVTTYTYHDAGLPAPLDAGLHTKGGRLCRVSGEWGVTIFDYDALGNLATKRSRPANTDVEYRLDVVRRADGQVSAVTFPESGGTRLTVHHQYDEVGRLVAVPGFIDAVDYDERGRRTRLHFANGVTEVISRSARHTFEAAGTVTEAPWGSQIWDAFGQLRGVHGNDGTNTLFGYDHTGRLVRTLVSDPEGVSEVLTPDEMYAIENGELVVIIAGAWLKDS